ncbi:MAG TPA: protein phosphatase 2C domain-containing protein [Candidatus Dormibacteraeota bacterium]
MTDELTSRVVADGSSGVEVAGATDRGTVRVENQDMWTAFAATPAEPAHGTALVIADGMGGHRGGREAAEAAVEAAAARLRDGGAPPQAVEAAVHEANAAVAGVRDLIGGDPGTTLVVAVVDGRQALIGNVGDSRAYLVRGGRAELLTFDHSVAGEEVRAGRIRPEDVRSHPRRNRITRAVLGDPVAPDLVTLDLRAGDTLVLCTDGVWEPLSDQDIAELLSNGGPLIRDVERLCEAAIDAGGSDNVTAVAARLAGGR